MLGTEYTDTITLGSGLVITEQLICVASTSAGFGSVESVDGILVLGPVVLTQGTLLNEPTTTIPTVTQNLYNQRIIAQEVFSISFEPTSQSPPVTSGELTFGGTDFTKYTDSIAYT